MNETVPASAPAWTPAPQQVESARITRFMKWLGEARGLAFDDYDSLWRWSVEDIDAFWCALWDWAQIPSREPRGVALADAAMPGARWFPGVELNYVERAFQLASDARPAIVSRSESGPMAGRTRELSWAE
ncbi:acetyl-coenzyme A synthetase N-terminal domain-containing protein, partial [Paraburkholderia sp. BR14261]